MTSLHNPHAQFDDKLQAAFEQNILAALLEEAGFLFSRYRRIRQ